MAEAVEALSQLHSREMRQKLRNYVRQQGNEQTLVVRHGDAFLNNRDPFFWCHCFMRLFPRGDCAERCEARGSRTLSNWRWIKTLLTRSDTTLWRQDVEFIASVYNVHLRREQVQAVEAVFRSGHLTDEELRNLQAVAAKGLMATALAEASTSMTSARFSEELSVCELSGNSA